MNTYSEDALNKLAAYLAQLESYSRIANLTGLSEPRTLAGEIVIESLRLLELGDITPGSEVVDLGSGNGSPVVPLAIACPDAMFVAAESRLKRCAFLRNVKAALGLKNLEVKQTRAEDLAERYAASFDIVTSRAFASPPDYFAVAKELLAPGGEIRGYFNADTKLLKKSAADAGLHFYSQISYNIGDSPRCIYVVRAS